LVLRKTHPPRNLNHTQNISFTASAENLPKTFNARIHGFA
jgi:hypothetical protein